MHIASGFELTVHVVRVERLYPSAQHPINSKRVLYDQNLVTFLTGIGSWGVLLPAQASTRTHTSPDSLHHNTDALPLRYCGG